MGNRDMGKLAIRFGVDVNLVNFEGNSALHVACASGELAVLAPRVCGVQL